ncbi:MAG: hypothetical protein PHX54_09415 [Lentimicrobiaceae bacterium]|nr:hypothetical protein [Lentimicrobiaceae bacterium]
MIDRLQANTNMLQPVFLWAAHKDSEEVGIHWSDFVFERNISKQAETNSAEAAMI